MSPVDYPSIQSKSWQPLSTEQHFSDAQNRPRRDSRSRSKSVNQVQTINQHFPDQRAQSVMVDNVQPPTNHTEKARRRRRSRSGSKSFQMDDESPALHSLQEMISTLKQIPPKAHQDHNHLSPIRTSSPTSIDFLHTADPDNRDTITSKHVPQLPTSHEPIFPNSKSWNSTEENYRHPRSIGTSQGSTNSFSQRMNSYDYHNRKGSYSSYSSR